MKKISNKGLYSGRIAIPSSKSDGQRALLAASLASGTSILFNVGKSDDELAVLNVIQNLGAQVEIKQDQFCITGTNKIPKNLTINIGESGLATRLLSGVFAFSEGTQTIDGKGSILKRKMDFFFEHALEFDYSPAPNEKNQLPLIFTDKVTKRNIKVDGSQSSQDISGLLFGLALTPEEAQITIQNLKSVPYLNMTLNTLAHFGVEFTKISDTEYLKLSNQHLKATTYQVEGDWSAASFWIVANALGCDISIENLQLNSLQADKQIINILTTANCSIIRGNDLRVIGTRRTPITTDLTHCPDLFPPLVTYAALTPGISILSGVHRLFNKESNRAEALISEFSKLGVQIYVVDDQMIIEGKNEINGGTVNSHHDHRIAMCLAIAGMFSTEPIEIENAEAVSKSYPDFWNDFEQLIRSN